MNLQRKIFLITFLGMIVIVGFLSLQPRNDFPSGKAGAEIEFLIEDGELGSSIATNLESKGVIKSAAKFVEEFTKDPKAQGISAGSHSIEINIPVKTAIAQLLDPKRLNNLLVVKEGSSLSDVLGLLRSNEHISKTDTSYASVKSLFPKSTKSLEGSLFPARYSFEDNISIANALNLMVAKANTEYEKTGLFAGYEKYKPFDLLIIASMVQIEGDPATFSRVARVIYNRLRIGMPLQLNATLQYATNSRGKIMLSNKATKLNSPYNTYKYLGLPPTPISNPSLDAIEATLKPASGDWLYFITVAPRDTRFTKDFAEFSNWNTEFNNNVAAGKFK
jgi:UPF0755 protein